jgi:DNA-binding response OmpR family regulator
VLVVEDDADTREPVILALNAEGYEAVGAATGEEALTLLRSGQVAPCIILLDLMMPGMNGWQFREALSHVPHVAHVPVIYVSGLRNTLDTMQAGAMRGAATLLKPVDMDKLLAAVEKHSVKS